jgi:hypothetical protein
VVNLKTKAQEWDGWRKILSKPRRTKHCSANNSDNFYTVGKTPRKGDQHIAKPLPTHRAAQTSMP